MVIIDEVGERLEVERRFVGEEKVYRGTAIKKAINS
jgi:hypothetical protein